MFWIEYDKDGMIGEKGGEEACLALQDIVEHRQSQGNRKLTMQELFSSLLVAASQSSQKYTLYEKQQTPLSIVVVFEDGQKRGFSQPQEKQADEYIVRRLCEMITNTAQMYRLYVRRKPRLNEILACFHFILDMDWYRHRFLPLEGKIAILGLEHI
jgi:hypothetical protein